MKKIGNIVGKVKSPLISMFATEGNISDSDTGLPVLYVGINNARDNIKDFSLFKEQYGDNVFWTPSKREKRDDFIEKTEKFTEYCLERFTSKVAYEYVNITCYGYNRLKKLLNYIKGKDLKYCFITKGSRFIFFYSPRYNTVWGLSLSLCEYVGIPKRKILSLLTKNKSNLIVNNINSYCEEFIELKKIIGDKTHLIPIIYYLTTT